MGRAKSVSLSRLSLYRRLVFDRTAMRRWLVVLVLAATTGALTRRIVVDAAATQSRWGDTAIVLVTSRKVPAGGSLAGAVREERWPLALRPPTAISRVGPHDRAAVPLDPGVPLTSGMRRGGPAGGDGGPEGRLVAIVVGPDHLPVEPGDHVDVWATVDPSLGPGAGGERGDRRTDLVVRDAVVARADERSVVVRVETGDAGTLAEAVALATVTLVAHG